MQFRIKSFPKKIRVSQKQLSAEAKIVIFVKSVLTGNIGKWFFFRTQETRSTMDIRTHHNDVKDG